MKDAPCWICGEPSFCMGGKAGLPKILVCKECFAVTNGELSVKLLRSENAALRRIFKAGTYLLPLRFHTVDHMRVDDSWAWRSIPYTLWDNEDMPVEFDSPDAAIDAAVEAMKGEKP